MDADEFHKLLGKATSQAQSFEMSVHSVLGVCLGLNNELALRLGGHLSLRTALEVIAEIAATPKCQMDGSRVEKWLASAREANTARNRVVHSPWYGDSKGKMLGIINVRKKGAAVWAESRSASDLQKDIDLMLAATAAAQQLTGLAQTTAKKR